MMMNMSYLEVHDVEAGVLVGLPHDAVAGVLGGRDAAVDEEPEVDMNKEKKNMMTTNRHF